MIKSLRKRAQKAGLSDRIETRICDQSSLGLNDLNEKIDFALAYAVVHEVPDVHQFFNEINRTLKPTGQMLIVEPKGHVSKKNFNLSISEAQQNGFKIINRPLIRRNHAVLLKKEVPR
jgi:ubiquinone/menaquinone biosynthesis C-methylase UbiE